MTIDFVELQYKYKILLCKICNDYEKKHIKNLIYFYNSIGDDNFSRFFSVQAVSIAIGATAEPGKTTDDKDSGGSTGGSDDSGGSSTSTDTTGLGGLIYVGDNSSYNLSGGTLTGSNAKYGGAVYISDGGTFNMSGGSIYSNTATTSGSQVYNAGTFKLTGGSIGTSGSSSTKYGIYNAGNLILSGGNVYDSVYSEKDINASVKANISGRITLGNNACLNVNDYIEQLLHIVFQ